MHVFLSKSTRFESTDFASVMIDDVGYSRRHQCPQCAYGMFRFQHMTLYYCREKSNTSITKELVDTLR